MSRKLIVTRMKEVRKGWSYRGFDFLVELDEVLIGMVRDGETVSFPISEQEQFLEILPRNGRRKPSWCAIIPAGKEDCSVSVCPYTNREPTVELASAAQNPQFDEQDRF